MSRNTATSLTPNAHVGLGLVLGAVALAADTACSGHVRHARAQAAYAVEMCNQDVLDARLETRIHCRRNNLQRKRARDAVEAQRYQAMCTEFALLDRIGERADDDGDWRTVEQVALRHRALREELHRRLDG